MAAATIDSYTKVYDGPWQIIKIELSSLVSDQAENILHRGPGGVSPLMVMPVVTYPATSGDQITCEWHKASDSASANTVRVKFRVCTGGDISGAKATVFVVFNTRINHVLEAQSSGGLSALY